MVIQGDPGPVGPTGRTGILGAKGKLVHTTLICVYIILFTVHVRGYIHGYHLMLVCVGCMQGEAGMDGMDGPKGDRGINGSQGQPVCYAIHTCQCEHTIHADLCISGDAWQRWL